MRSELVDAELALDLRALGGRQRQRLQLGAEGGSAVGLAQGHGELDAGGQGSRALERGRGLRAGQGDVEHLGGGGVVILEVAQAGGEAIACARRLSPSRRTIASSVLSSSSGAPRLMKTSELPAGSTIVKRDWPGLIRVIRGMPATGSLPWTSRSAAAKVAYSGSTSGTITRHVLYACFGSSFGMPTKWISTAPRRVDAYT